MITQARKSPYVCTHGTCTAARHAKGFCKPHYQAALRNGLLVVKHCDINGCSRPHSARGLCAMHYQRAVRGTLEAPVPIAA